jgi:hypothetical protein
VRCSSCDLEVSYGCNAFILWKRVPLIQGTDIFNETNGSPREQVDLDDIDENEVSTAAMRTTTIGDVRPQEHQV